jgi:hypothetical protein
MPRKRRRRSRRSRNTSRRTFLLKAGVLGVGAVSLGQYVQSTGAFDLVTASRGVDVSVASGGDGIVGIVGQGDVQKNKREAMAKFTNNSPETVAITVTLDNPGDGALYDNEGGSGSSVTFSLPSGNIQYVDINADTQGVVPYSVSVTSAILSLNTTGSVEAVGGNANDFVRIFNLQDFQANSGAQNNWTLGEIQIEDRDGDDDLDRVEYEIIDTTGALRASRTTQISGGQYQNQDLTFSPDDSSYDLPEGEEYTLTATGYDVDGNSSSDTVTATSVGTGGPGGSCTIGSNTNPSTIQFSDLQNFTTNKGADRWTIGQVQVQDADGDNDLNKLKFEIADSGGSVRATETISISGQQYQDQNLKLNPDDPSYDVPKGETYTLTATVCDADGNSNTETRQSTA